MKFNVKHSVLAIALLGAFTASQASVLDENSSISSIDDVSNFFGGTLMAETFTNISNPSYTGVARSAVYETAAGTMDFYYQFSSSLASLNGVERLTGFNYSSLGASTVGVYQTNAAFGEFVTGTVQSSTADRSDLGVIGFNFLGNGNSKINPGTSSFTQIVRTNATAYQTGSFGLLDGVGANGDGFAPAAPIPEPETYAMLFAGLGLMGTIVRRRKGKSQDENFVA